jgi:phage shock protein E
MIVLALGVLAFALARRLALITESNASAHLRQGAIVVDVRTPEEFQQRHLPGALNMPLAEFPANIISAVSAKDQVILLHCLGGGRSAMAQRLLRKNGYLRAFNLGSYRRADSIVRKTAG